MQRAANNVRVNAQLIDARTTPSVSNLRSPWTMCLRSKAETRQSHRLPAASQTLTDDKSCHRKAPTTDLAAHDVYVRAKLLMLTGFLDPGNLFEAARLLDQAIAREADFFLAYCLSAETNSRLYWVFDHTPARRDLADRAVKAALHLRPEAGEGHLERARYLYMCNVDYDDARAELALAQRTLPNNAQVFALLGHIDHLQGRWNESARSYEKALELDPRNLFTLRQLAIGYIYMRRFAESAATLDRAVAVAPQDVELRVFRASLDLEWRAD